MNRGAGRASVIGCLVAIVLALSACTSSPDPSAPDASARPVTTEEAQLLAVTRFNNYDAGTRPFSTTLTEQGAELTVTGWIDYVAHVGYASVTGAFDPQAMVWSDTTVGIIPQTPDEDGNPILPMPAADAEWQSRPLDPTTSRLDAMLAVLSSLGSDRPDNPLLVQQTGALWLRDDTVDTHRRLGVRRSADRHTAGSDIRAHHRRDVVVAPVGRRHGADATRRGSVGGRLDHRRNAGCCGTAACPAGGTRNDARISRTRPGSRAARCCSAQAPARWLSARLE